MNYRQRYYQENREKELERVKAKQRRHRKEMALMKIARGCDRCGYRKSSWALDWHHTTGEKEHNITRMVGQGRSPKAIAKEIEKCILLCKNCHAEEHEALSGIV